MVNRQINKIIRVRIVRSRRCVVNRAMHCMRYKYTVSDVIQKCATQQVATNCPIRHRSAESDSRRIGSVARSTVCRRE